MPKFALYASVERGSVKESTSSVTFSVNERVPRLINWIETRFNTKVAPNPSKPDSLETTFLCLRDNLPLSLRIQPASNNAVQVVVATDNMDMAGDMVTDLVSAAQHSTAQYESFL